MTIIIDNSDPNRRPDAPVPPGLNKSVPAQSDTIEYSGPLFHDAPFAWGEFPNEVAVTFKKIARQRTWTNLAQFHTNPNSGGSYDEQATEGVSTATAIVERWEATLGVEVSAGFGPLSASMSASLSRSGEQSVSVDLYKSISRTIQFNFEKGKEAEIAAWQLDEAFYLRCWIFVWQIPGADPSKVTAAMIDDAQQQIETALRNGQKPNVPHSYVLPCLASSTNQYTTTSYPPSADGANRITVK
jgi:hypothetical protein